MNYIDIKEVFCTDICPICNKQTFFGECGNSWNKKIIGMSYFYSSLGRGGLVFYLYEYTFNTLFFSKNSGHFEIFKNTNKIYSSDFEFNSAKDIYNLANKTMMDFKNNELFL